MCSSRAREGLAEDIVPACNQPSPALFMITPAGEPAGARDAPPPVRARGRLETCPVDCFFRGRADLNRDGQHGDPSCARGFFLPTTGTRTQEHER
jgi:hypothetical protein